MAEYIFEIPDALYNEQTSEAVIKPNVKGELIRCKDCKHFETCSWSEHKDDGFCKWGERNKTNENNAV